MCFIYLSFCFLFFLFIHFVIILLYYEIPLAFISKIFLCFFFYFYLHNISFIQSFPFFCFLIPIALTIFISTFIIFKHTIFPQSIYQHSIIINKSPSNYFLFPTFFFQSFIFFVLFILKNKKYVTFIVK